MKKLRKIIAVVLVCLMAFSALQISASAADVSADSIKIAVERAAEQAANGEFPVGSILVGILYAFIPILIVIDLVSYLASGNAIIAGSLLGMIN